MFLLLFYYSNVILNLYEEEDRHSLLESNVSKSALLAFLLLVSDSEGLIKGDVGCCLLFFIELGFGKNWIQKANLKKLGNLCLPSCPPQGIQGSGLPAVEPAVVRQGQAGTKDAVTFRFYRSPRQCAGVPTLPCHPLHSSSRQLVFSFPR